MVTTPECIVLSAPDFGVSALPFGEGRSAY